MSAFPGRPPWDLSHLKGWGHKRLMSNVGLFFFFFFADLSQFLHVGFVLVNKHCPVFFFVGLLFVFEKKRMQKNSVFLAASFGDLLLNEKQ